MQVAFTGVGRTGGSIVDEFLAYERRTGAAFVAAAMAIGTGEGALDGLQRVPQANRLPIAVPAHADGDDPGVRGATAVRDAQGAVVSALTDLANAEIDAALVAVDLADGVAAGGAAALARLFARLFEVPVLGLAVLPGEGENAAIARTAVRSLATLDREAAGVVLVDPAEWGDAGVGSEAAVGADAENDPGDAEVESDADPAGTDAETDSEPDAEPETAAETAPKTGGLPATVAERFGLLCRVGDAAGIDDRTAARHHWLDAWTVVETLATGGAVSVGYADRLHDGGGEGGLDLPLLGDDPDESEAADGDPIPALVDAALDDPSLDCEVADAERVLVVVTAAPEDLDDGAPGRAKQRLVAVTGEPSARAGGYPTPGSDRVAVAVILAGVTDAPRLLSLREAALAASALGDGSGAPGDDSGPGGD